MFLPVKYNNIILILTFHSGEYFYINNKNKIKWFVHRLIPYGVGNVKDNRIRQRISDLSIQANYLFLLRVSSMSK